MHYAYYKITPNLLFEYQCTSGKFIRLPNRIESKLFCPNWNALVTTSQSAAQVDLSSSLQCDVLHLVRF